MNLDIFKPFQCDNDFGGSGHISGVLKVDGVPSSRRIILTARNSRRIIATKFSSPDGSYRFDGLNVNGEFDLRAQDWKKLKLDAVISGIVPKSS